MSVLIFKVGLNQVTLGAKLLLINLWLWIVLWILVEREMMRMSNAWIVNHDGMAATLETRSDWIMHWVVIESASECYWILQFLILSS